MSRVFAHFPTDSVCPICETNDDKPTTLVPIVGTETEGLAEAIPIHADCARIQRWDSTYKFGYVRPKETK